MNLPYGYLIGLAVLAFPVLRMPRMPMALGTSVFFLSMTINELQPLVTLAFVASTALAFTEGDLASPVAIVAAVLTAGCLALSWWRASRALPILREAMGSTAFSGGLPLGRILLLPLRVRPWSVERVRNLAYGPAGRRQLVDLYRRRGAAGPAPVLIHLHGGYYTTGHKSSQSMPLLHHLAERGWVCLSANYRLRPTAGFEDHVVDVKLLVAWVREHAAEWGMDPDRIVLSGSSAGAHMSMMAAFTPGEAAFQPGFEGVDTSVRGVVALGGYLGRYFGRGAETSPTESVRADAPPLMVVHGDNDSVASVDGARAFAAAARAVSKAPVVYAELPGAQHGFDLYYSLRFGAVVGAVEAFATRAVSTARVDAA